MAEIIPFKGTLYNQEKIKDLSRVFAPPYDVISPEEQQNLYNTDPHNIIRILLGKDFPGDNDRENKYSRAANFLKEWQRQMILIRDKDPSIYLYLQEFQIYGQTKRRLGFIALLKLEDFDAAHTTIYPHESTMDEPKKDRLKLLSSIEANLDPIFALFADEDKSIESSLKKISSYPPVIDIVDQYGIRNKLWRLSDRDKIKKIIQLMKDKKIFIADGHHRYEVGLMFSKTKKNPKFGYILTYFTNLYSNGVIILPVHRMIRCPDRDTLHAFETDLGKSFILEEIASRQDIEPFLAAAGALEKRFVIYDGRRFTGLRHSDKDPLDVNVLHRCIIEPLNECSSSQGAKISIEFTKDLDYAINEVDKGRFSLCIMVNPTKVTQVRDMAFSGRRMPQKSTYFYPKVLTGLVINIF